MNADFTEEDIKDLLIIQQKSESEAFKLGQKNILDKLMTIAKPWIQGKITNEIFAQKLNEFFNDYGNTKN